MKKILSVLFLVFLSVNCVCSAAITQNPSAMQTSGLIRIQSTPRPVNNTISPYTPRTIVVPSYYRNVYYRPILYRSNYIYPYYDSSDSIICINKSTEDVIDCSSIKSMEKSEYFCINKNTNKKVNCLK